MADPVRMRLYVDVYIHEVVPLLREVAHMFVEVDISSVVGDKTSEVGGRRSSTRATGISSSSCATRTRSRRPGPTLIGWRTGLAGTPRGLPARGMT
jgi:hypothetical protein